MRWLGGDPLTTTHLMTNRVRGPSGWAHTHTHTVRAQQQLKFTLQVNISIILLLTVTKIWWRDCGCRPPWLDRQDSCRDDGHFQVDRRGGFHYQSMPPPRKRKSVRRGKVVRGGDRQQNVNISTPTRFRFNRSLAHCFGIWLAQANDAELTDGRIGAIIIILMAPCSYI